ncbi:DUF2510 domain-containing protein [Demequina aurantiaca]|uniref:DUF2510 domain-containing protein n=1 Tax=Demequina aurantiaca TaxID=676200 RepID=UPI000785B6F0|nr:DUF2510 domain-containing protein [Demequina aurantiaca]
MPEIPANWYDDGSGRLRYWDGQAWTEHFADTYVPPAPAAPPAGQAPPAQQAQHYQQAPLAEQAVDAQQASPPAQGFGPAQPSAAATPQSYAPQSWADAPGTHEHAGPTYADGQVGAYSDPFAMPPRQDAHHAAASAPRKKLPGWGLALIIVGVLAVIGVIVGVIVLIVVAVRGAADLNDSVFDDFEDPYAAALPYELESVYWELDAAYREDSCPALMAVTTPNYFESLGLDPTSCVDVFNLDEEETGFEGTPESGDILGSHATLTAYETYALDGEFYGGEAVYTLVNIDGEWLFDSLEYPED